MTALQLLALIGTALLLQLVIGGAFMFWRRQSVAVAPPVVEVAVASAAGPAAWVGWRDFRVVRRTFEDAAQSQCSFHLQPVDGVALLPFRPGQFLTFKLHLDAAGTERSLTRCYSLSDKPDPSLYRITVKRMTAPAGQPAWPPGLSSSHLHDHVREGDVLSARAPSGHFCIDPDPTVPAVFIAGGIGITPMMSMLAWCFAEQPGRTLHLYYGVRNSADHAFKAVLEELARTHAAFRLHVVYSSPQDGDVLARDHHHVGHVDLDLLRRNLPHGRHQFYVCGPPAMMQSLVPALREWGVLEQDIHFEAFGPASGRPAGPMTNEPVAPASTGIEVRLLRSGRSLVWDGQDANLLDFADRHSVAVDSGCRSGSCGSCETRLVSGRVRYAEKPDHDIAAGHCLLCVGVPESPLVLEA